MENGAAKQVRSFAIGLCLLCAVPVVGVRSLSTFRKYPPRSSSTRKPRRGCGLNSWRRALPPRDATPRAGSSSTDWSSRFLDPSRGKLAWQLRIVDDDQLNAYSSPDGTVYGESGLARLAGPSAGLWAAILSHEIAHIVRREWARRYLYQKYLENGGGAAIVLGDPNLPSASWQASEKGSADMGRFGRQMEQRNGMPRRSKIHRWSCLPKNLRFGRLEGKSGKSRFRCGGRTWRARLRWSCTQARHWERWRGRSRSPISRNMTSSRGN